MQTVSNGLVLTAVLNGTTISGFIRVDNLPLVQRYKTGTNQFIPDFEALPENARPVAYPFLRSTDTGDVLTPSTVIFKYNSIELTFDGNNLSNNSGMAGVFKLIPEYSVVVSGVTYKIRAIRIMKNLTPISSYDNDLLTIGGTIEIGGQQVPFEELHKEVIIEESTGNQYDVVISNNKGSQLVSENDSLIEVASIYKDGVAVSDLSGFSFKWYKELGTGEEQFGGTSATQVIKTSDVNNVLKIRCDVIQDGSVIASGYDEITDFSDPYDLELSVTGIQGTQVFAGEVATITPGVVERSSRNPVSGYIFFFTIKDNAGNLFVLTGQSNSTIQATKIDIPYNDIIRAKRGLHISVTARKS